MRAIAVAGLAHIEVIPVGHPSLIVPNAAEGVDRPFGARAGSNDRAALVAARLAVVGLCLDEWRGCQKRNVAGSDDNKRGENDVSNRHDALLPNDRQPEPNLLSS